VESKWKSYHIILFLDSLFRKNGDRYVSSAWEDGREEDEEEDVGGCWMTLGMGEDVLI
jgi:hypothetical protein